MSKSLCLLILLLGKLCIAQPITTQVDSALNSLKQRKLTYKKIDIIGLAKAPEHIRTAGIKIATRDTLFLFGFLPADHTVNNRAGDSSLLKRNPAYLHYTLGQHGSKRAFYYKGKFKTLETEDTVSMYIDTAITIATRLHRYIFTQWETYDGDTKIPGMHIAFVFNKNNKLLRQLTYDNDKIDFGTAVGFYNKDDLLDMIAYDRVEQGSSGKLWHFSLYSFNKKGKVKKRKFNKAGHSIEIPGKG